MGEFLAELRALALLLTPGEDTMCGRGRKEPILSRFSRPLLLPYMLDSGFTGKLRLSVGPAPRPLPGYSVRDGVWHVGVVWVR